MSVFSASLPRTVVLGAAFLPGAAFAELSADDVWQHFKTVSALYGGALEGETSVSGDELTISGMRFNADLPFDAGKLSLDLGEMALREISGGKVAMIYPSTMVMQLTYTSPDGESFGGGMTLTHQNLVSEASGQPGNITFDYAASRIDVKIDIPELPDGVESYSASGYFTGLSGRSTQDTASGLASEARFEVGEHAFSGDQVMSLEDEDGRMQVTNTSGGAGMTGSGKVTIPENGIDLVNLAKSLRDGFAVSGSANITGYTTNQIMAQDGAVIARQGVSAASYETTVALDRTGVLVEGPSKDLRIEVEMPAMGGMVFGANVASGYGKLRAPLLMDEAFAPAEIKLDLLGLAPDETLWGMFDPTGILPHDAADLSLDLVGQIRHRVEWLDFANVEAAMGALNGLPIEPESVRLNQLRLSALGAEITGEGAFTFDLNDLQSFDGMPRPEGKLTLRAKGLNALSQKLLAMGLPEDDITGGMMMLGMFTMPDPEGGDDARMSVLEVTPDGQVLNNGMRVR